MRPREGPCQGPILVTAVWGGVGETLPAMISFKSEGMGLSRTGSIPPFSEVQAVCPSERLDLKERKGGGGKREGGGEK